MKIYLLFPILFLVHSLAFSQSNIKGKLIEENETPIAFANVVLYDTTGTMIKVATTEDAGIFEFQGISTGVYKLVASYIGLDDLVVPDVTVNETTNDLGTLTMTSGAIELETAVIKAKRAMVEVKADRTVFNVEGTINSTGDNGMGLLRKAPGVLVDNNNNITVLGRSGVLVYIDGKRLPLSGDDLTAYLENLQSDQIDKMDIITNPGSKYEAEGNAGIIDIRLKKDKNLGSNGSVSSTITQGKRTRANASVSGNYRNKRLNTFGNIGYMNNDRISEIDFDNFQNQFKLDENTTFESAIDGINYRLGTDFFVAKNHTVGFLVSGNSNNVHGKSNTQNSIALQRTPTVIDSILIANSKNDNNRKQNTFNVNYAYTGKKSSVNVDLDYGKYDFTSTSLQPNKYFKADKTTLLSGNTYQIKSPSTIDIYTGKVDYELQLASGTLGLGTKYSNVSTDNTFLYYQVLNGTNVRNDKRSNLFDYSEKVTAGYANYAGSLSQKVNYSAGLRVEHTNAIGTLTAYDPSLNEDPVQFDYVSYFPSAGISYAASPMHNWTLNYGRRINRPDYNVLNPFEEQISELSFAKGNPFLKPEIVNNLELGYTYAYRYNVKLGYSKTTDQITRLIGPDKREPRAGYFSWGNIAEKTVISMNVSIPTQLYDWWSIYVNLSANHINNQADYGDDGVVDLKAFSYTVFQQSTFQLGGGFSGEISGYYSGPGIWGGVFKYDPSYSLNFGIQKKFFNDKLNVKLSANDVTFQSGWSGYSDFNGLRSEGNGNWDSRFVSLSLNYKFGNNNVKSSRRRQTGLDSESKRTGGGNTNR